MCSNWTSYAHPIQQRPEPRQTNTSVTIPEGIGVIANNTCTWNATQAIEEGTILAESACSVDPESSLNAAASYSIPLFIWVAERNNRTASVKVWAPFISWLACIIPFCALLTIPISIWRASWAKTRGDWIKSIIAKTIYTITHRIRRALTRSRNTHAHPINPIKTVHANTGCSTPVLISIARVRHFTLTQNPDLGLLAHTIASDGIERLTEWTRARSSFTLFFANTGIASSGWPCRTIRNTDSIIYSLKIREAFTEPINSHLNLTALWNTISILVIIFHTSLANACIVNPDFVPSAIWETIFPRFVPVSSIWACYWHTLSNRIKCVARNTFTSSWICSYFKIFAFRYTSAILSPLVSLQTLALPINEFL